jgi:hypothetical protein
MCKTLKEGTICNGTCSCPTDAYYNSNNVCYQCPANWFFANDTCFYIFNSTTQLCWNSAQAICMSYGGKLAQLSNTALLNGITSILDGKNYWVGARGFTSSGISCNSGCPTIRWVSSCDSCSSSSSGISTCQISCSTHSCYGSGNCCNNDCRCSGIISINNWCSGFSSTSTDCLLYDGINKCFKSSSCTNTANYICQY